jgi:NADH-quinone oxidoreductase subunit N
VLIPLILPRHLFKVIRMSRIYCWLIFIVFFLVLMFSIFLLCYVRFITPTSNFIVYIFNNNFRIDYYLCSARTFIIFIGFLIILAIRYPLSRHRITKNLIEFPIFIILGIWFMLAACSLQNLMGIYLCIEGLAILLYILSALNIETENFSECTNKYFTMSVLASGLLLVGILLLYLIIGSVCLPEVFLYLEFFQSQLITFEHTNFLFIIFTLSFFIKLGCFPGHQWVPDVYENCSLIIMIYFATIVKFTIFIIFIKIFIIFIQVSFVWQPLIYYFILLSIIIGTIGACGQSVDIKRFIAFTSISQAGYVLIGFCFSNSLLGLSASSIYVYIYILSMLLFFIPILHVRAVFYKKIYILNMSDLQNIAQTDLRILSFFIISLGSMSGTPPFIGFFAKICFLDLIISESFYILFFCILICSCLGTYNYIKILVEIFARPWASAPMNNSFFFKFIPDTLSSKILICLVVFNLFGYGFRNYIFEINLLTSSLF